MMQQKLSIKQQRAYDFIAEHLARSGFPPTVREIALHLGLPGPNSAKKILDSLVRKGCISRQPGCPRAIRINGRSSTPGGIPVAGVIRAGEPSLALDEIEGHVAVDPGLARGEGLFFLRVRGGSMTGAHILDGDLALIRPQPEVESGEIAAVLIGEEATLKFFYRGNNSIRLEPANPAFEPITLEGERAASARIIGKVIAVIRKME